MADHEHRGRAGHVHVEASLRGSPLLGHRFVQGFTRFLAGEPGWRIVSRAAGFAFTSEWLRQRGVDGVIAWGDEPALKAARQAAIPGVQLVSRQASGQRRAWPAVDLDHEAVGQLAGRTLRGRGFEHVAYCGIGLPWSDRRARGFAQAVCLRDEAVARIDLPFDPGMHDALGSDDSRRLAEWLQLQPRPLAVFAALDVVAALVVEVALELGLNVPEDVAVLGVGNHAMICEVAPVPIASVELPLPAVAERACEVLRDLIAGQPPPEAPIRLPPEGVVMRRSADVWAYPDPLVRAALSLIRQPGEQPTRVADIARQLHVSERTLTRRFTAATGHGPAYALRRARAELAADMIRHSRLGLSDVAQRAGFADQAHLCREIRHFYQQTPTALRRHSR